MDNVNNLNGVPNFGHGYDEPVPEVAPEVVEAEEVAEIVESLAEEAVEDAPKRGRPKKQV